MTAPRDEAERLLAADGEPERVRGVRLLRDAVEPRPAAERLVTVLADPGRYVPHAARAALQTLGAEALPALLAGLAAPDAAVRTGCAWALARPQGARAETVARALGERAQDAVAAVRVAVAGGLGRIGGAGEPRAAWLARLAADADTDVRVEALRALGGDRDLAARGRAALLRALDDGQMAVRLAAAEALSSVAPDAALRERVREALAEEPDGPVVAPLRALLETAAP